jgi:hypothetical protein
MLEKYGFYLLVLGVALAAVAWLWLLARAFKVRFLWGLALLLLPSDGPARTVARRR